MASSSGKPGLFRRILRTTAIVIAAAPVLVLISYAALFFAHILGWHEALVQGAPWLLKIAYLVVGLIAVTAPLIALAGIAVFFVPGRTSALSRAIENTLFASWFAAVMFFVIASQLGRGVFEPDRSLWDRAVGVAPIFLGLVSIVWAWRPERPGWLLARRGMLFACWLLGVGISFLLAAAFLGELIRAPAAPSGQSPIANVPGVVRIAATVDFPAVAMILKPDISGATDGQGFQPACSGVLVSNASVLTAAHCICGTSESSTSEACKRGLSQGAGGEGHAFDAANYLVFFHGVGVRRVSSVLVHPSYISFASPNAGQYRAPAHDLAILNLQEPLDEVRPMPLLPRKVANNEVLVVVGFGRHFRFDEESRDPAELLGRPVPHRYGVKLHAALRADDCGIWNEGPGFRLPVPSAGRICSRAATLERVSDFYEISAGPCNGDSGGPLLAPGAKWNAWNEYALAGITSFGDPNCNLAGDAGTPGRSLFIDVRPDRDWITSNVKTLPATSGKVEPLAAILNPDERFMIGLGGYFASPTYPGSKLYYPSNNSPTRWTFYLEDTALDGSAKKQPERLVLTVNASCAYNRTSTCEGDDFAMRVVDPDGIEIPQCTRDTNTREQDGRQKFAFGCTIAKPAKGWRLGEWTVYLMPVDVPGSDAGGLDQDLQLALVAY